MKRTENLHIAGFNPLITPKQLKHMVPQSDEAGRAVVAFREQFNRILAGEDSRLAVIVGPCSIHDPAGAEEYAQRLKALNDEVADRIFLLMRVYFEKPRTSIGWKGLINDPHLDGSHDIVTGLRIAREFLAYVTELGLPAACEILEPITPHYLADHISWGAIGARTTESQIHREMASGLSFPVGFKNGTDGSLMVAVNAMQAARSPHSFLGINEDGISCIVQTTGNPQVHAVLRGGDDGPNFQAEAVRETEGLLADAGLESRIMIDCSHANSGKDPRRQEEVFGEILTQVQGGNRSIFGVMVESYLEAGRQAIGDDPAELVYGVSVTDGCVDWECTERMIREAHARLA